MFLLLVPCPINNVAFVRRLRDQLAVFKAVRAALALTTSKSKLIRKERATQKNSHVIYETGHQIRVHF
jgi:hypothetical protein